MKVGFSDQGWNDFLSWRSDVSVFERLVEIIQDVRRSPFNGLGKPEPLKHELKGWWSRRVTQRDGLVYQVGGAGAERIVQIAQCRSHY